MWLVVQTRPTCQPVRCKLIAHLRFPALRGPGSFLLQILIGSFRYFPLFWLALGPSLSLLTLSRKACWLRVVPYTFRLDMWSNNGLNTLHPNISMHILHTVLYTFSVMPTWRICQTIKSFFSRWSATLFSWPSCLIQGWHGKEKLDASHS